MKNTIKSMPKYWYKGPPKNNITEAEKYSFDDETVNLQGEQAVTKIMVDNQTLRSQNRKAAQKLQKIAQKLQQIKNFNINFNEKFIDPNQNIIQIRCPQHNSPIILYCLNDSKLLCVNCAFGNELHKKHTVNEAAKEGKSIGDRVKQIDKNMKESISRLQTEKNKWQQLLSQVQKNGKKAMSQLQKAHDSALATLSDIFVKYRKQNQEAYKINYNSLDFTIKSFDLMIKALRYDHPLQNIKHLYMQYAIEQIAMLPKVTPNIMGGNNIGRALDKFFKMSIKSFKTIITRLNRF